MKRIGLTFFLVLTLTLILSTQASAEEIRVRIRSARLENEVFSLSSDDGMDLYYHLDGQDRLLMPLNTQNLFVRINGYYSSHENFRYYPQEGLSTNIGPYSVRLTDYQETKHEEIVKLQQALKDQHQINTYIYTNGRRFELWAGQFVSLQEARSFRDRLMSQHGIQSTVNDRPEVIYLYNSQNQIVACLENNYRFFVYNSNNDNNFLRIDSKPYRGSVGFYIIDGFRLLSINKVDVEAYLKGVVASEMPASWPLEALKVQAITARSYALSLIDPNYSAPYDAQDNQNSQVYNGIWGERESTNLAVESTRGQLIYYNNRVIAAYYHSTSGGMTDNSENVWHHPLPYIRGVDDPYSNISPYTEWDRILSEEQIIESLRENGYQVNQIFDIYEKSRSEFERVLELVILTDQGEITLHKEGARRVIGYSRLISTWYTFHGNHQATLLTASGEESSILGGKQVLTSQGQKQIMYKDNQTVLTASGLKTLPTSSDTYHVHGRGFGHGLGLSQYGARGMAEQGYNYIQIIQYYYTGVEVR